MGSSCEAEETVQLFSDETGSCLLGCDPTDSPR